jgi:hypothetical protein
VQQLVFEQPGDHFPLLQLELAYSSLQLWWPVGYGGQPLYNLTAALAPRGGSCCGAGQPSGCDDLCSRQSRWSPLTRHSALAAARLRSRCTGPPVGRAPSCAPRLRRPPALA